MLDCDTALGKTFIKNENKVADILSSKYGYILAKYSDTESGKSVSNDRLILKEVNGSPILKGIAEIKSRKTAGGKRFDYDYLQKAGTYLISNHKIVDGQKLSALLKVPYLVIVDLMQDSWILSWKITDSNGEFLFDFQVEQTKTQDNCNGGVAFRHNAFLPIGEAKRILK